MNSRLPTCTRIVALAGVLALLPAPPGFATAPATPQKITTVEGITEYHLANGLRVLLFRDDSTPTVTVDLTVLVGSRMEGYGETGMAHLLEHMLFKGTPTFPHIPQVLKEHGGNFNANTAEDRTTYWEVLPGTQDNLEFALHLESDRLINSNVLGKDLQSEMTVVRNEFEKGENSPDYILSQRMMASAYQWHNYGKAVIGNRSDIERVPVERLQTFYHKYYQPDNAILVVAGHFDPDQALAAITRYFGPLKKPERKLEATYTEEPPQDGDHTINLRRVGTVGLVGLIYHIPAAAHDDFAALQVLNNILVSEPSGRLYKALVETKKASSVSAFPYPLHDPGVIEIEAEVEPKMITEVRDSMIDLLESLPGQKFTPEEVDRAKRQLLKARELVMTNSTRVAFQLTDWESRGDWRLFFLERDRLEKVTPQDVARVAGRYFVRNNRTAGLFFPTEKPERAVVPETPAVVDLVKDYKGTQTIAAGEAFDPTPANIEKRVRRGQLPSGLKTALLARKTRGESVVIRLELHYGSEESLKGHTTATEFLADLMTRGTHKHNRQQIQDELDRLGAQLTASGSLGQVTFNVQAKRQNLPAVLQLLGEIIRDPSLPAEEFDLLKRQSRAALEQELTEPSALAPLEIRRRLNPYPPEDVRYVPTLEEDLARIQAVTVEEVRKLYADQVGGQDGELAVVGDFDQETIARLATDLFGDWKAGLPYQRIPRPANTDVAGSHYEISTPDKANAVYVAGEKLALTDADPEYASLEVANFLFGGNTLASRLGNRIRQKEGLSYGVRSQFSADSHDKNGSFLISAITNPINIGKVNKAALEELDRLLKDGIGADELAEAKKSWLEQQKVQRANDSHLAAVLTDNLFVGRTFAYQADLEKHVADLTVEEVMGAVHKYLAPASLVIVEAGDFHKKSENPK